MPFVKQTYFLRPAPEPIRTLRNRLTGSFICALMAYCYYDNADRIGTRLAQPAETAISEIQTQLAIDANRQTIEKQIRYGADDIIIKSRNRFRAQAEKTYADNRNTAEGAFILQASLCSIFYLLAAGLGTRALIKHTRENNAPSPQ